MKQDIPVWYWKSLYQFSTLQRVVATRLELILRQHLKTNRI
jgi:hypothetical protein